MSARQNFCGAHLSTRGERSAGCSKGPAFSPAQPWRLFHPPALSLPRQTRRPGTRLFPNKAAASCHFIRGGWDDPNCAQYSTHPALSAPRRAFPRARAFQFPIPPFRGVAKAALNCAHRTIYILPPSLLVISLGGWGLIDLLLRASNEGLLRPRVARAQKIIRLHPLPALRARRTVCLLPRILLRPRVARTRGSSQLPHPLFSASC
jgi:hypothetical protein